jgi:flagellar protein FlaJ
MPEEKNNKNVKDSDSWDDDLSKISKKSSDNKSKDIKEEKVTATGPEVVPSAKDFESEWEEKIKEAKKSDKQLISEKTTTSKRADSLEDVFKQLKHKDELKTTKVSMGDRDRLDKIGGVVRGEVGQVKERQLTGEGVPGIYKLYPMGGLPPLNLLTKIVSNFGSDTLEEDLKKADIPLYPAEYFSFTVGVSFVFAVCMFILVFLLTQFNLVFALVGGLLVLILLSLLLVNLPSFKLRSGKRDVDKQLPFALRHMSALLTAGISIFDSIVSVSKADYGTLSHELDKVVWDVKSGENLSEALEDAAERINSHSFTRVTIHIRRALQMGGDVSRIISQIADDLTFEMRMKITDFVEKLNAFAIVYIIGGIVGPVVLAVFAVVGSAQLQGVASGGISLDSSMLAFMVLVIFPVVLGMITYIVKVMEPKV